MTQPSETKPRIRSKSTKFTDPSQIAPDARVKGSNGTVVGFVDHIEGIDSLQLKKDEQGVHHSIPLTGVSRVDADVHLDRHGEQAMREWSTLPPRG